FPAALPFRRNHGRRRLRDSVSCRPHRAHFARWGAACNGYQQCNRGDRDYPAFGPMVHRHSNGYRPAHGRALYVQARPVFFRGPAPPPAPPFRIQALTRINLAEYRDKTDRLTDYLPWALLI